MSLPITGLAAGTPKATDLHVAVDTTDTTMAPSGTDKKYTLSGLSSFILSNAQKFTTVYVSSFGGTNVTSSGTVLQPYATLAYAYSQITDATSSKIYVIKMSGVFSETTIQIKPWIFIDGQNSSISITNQVVIDSSFNASGGFSIIENFSNFNTVAGLNLDLTSTTSSCLIKLANLNVLSSSAWNILGSTTQECIAIVENIYGFSSTPSITIQNLNGSMFRCVPSGLSILATSATQSYNFSVEESEIIGELLSQSSASANLSVYAASNVITSGLRIVSVSNASIGFTQNAIALSAVTLDGTGITYNTDQRSSSITYLNSATETSNVVYRTISDGITANYSPVHYTPINPQLRGHLQGIDNALGGAGTGFLLAANNLSDVASVSTSRTNLGLGTMAVQNSNSITVTGGTIDGTSLGATTPSSVRATAITETTFASAGIVHNAPGGLFSSSLIATADIINNNVTNAKLAQMPADTIKGNNTGSTANAIDLTAAQVSTLLGLGTMSTQNANAVSISGGTINGTSIGATTASSVRASSITDTSFSVAGVVHNSSGGAFTSSLVVTADITPANVTNATLATMPNNTFKGNISGVTASPSDLTVSQMQTALGITASLTATQIAFGSATNTITSSANLVWDNTLLTFTALGAGSFRGSLRVANNAAPPYIAIGDDATTTGVIYGRANGAGQFFTGSTAGDACLRQGNSANSLLLGVGSAVPQIKISNGGVQLNSGTLDASSTFDVFSTTKGVRPIPSMTTTQRLAIPSPALNLQVFDITLGQGMFWNGTAWAIMY